MRYPLDGHDFFFPVKAEIEEKKNVEISTGNTPKSPDFQGKCTFFIDISSSKIVAVEISGDNKIKHGIPKSRDRGGG